MLRLALISLVAAAACAQEARYGFANPITLTLFTGHTNRGDADRPVGPIIPAFRANLYPTLKLGAHWFGYGAIQVHSKPYFYEEMASRDRSVELSVLQAYIGYSLVRDGRALTVKAGKLASAFGSFPLRYDDARNWLIDMPQSYGYYYYPVTVNGLPGVEVNGVAGRFDARAQFTNSSPSNPRRLWQSDQYANWTAGAGYVIQQGLRVGASFARGPYLHRQHRFYRAAEDLPIRLPATGFGLDVQWGRGRWTVNGEAQRFRYAYRAMPDFFNTLVYGEAKFNLAPRVYLAGRVGGRWHRSNLGADQAFEFAVGFRPAGNQLLKVGYEALRGPFSPGTRDNVLGVQYVITLNPPAIGR